jgi:hypothetical protein
MTPLPAPDRFALSKALASQPADHPLPDAIAERAWYVLSAVGALLKTERTARLETGPQGLRDRARVEIIARIEDTELACRALVDAVRGIADAG